MLRVGDVIKNERTGKDKDFSYTQIQYDEEGWADPAHYMPLEYDLVKLKTDSRIVKGWSTGFAWDGYKFKQGEKVIAWARLKENEVST